MHGEYLAVNTQVDQMGLKTPTERAGEDEREREVRRLEACYQVCDLA